MNSIVVDTFLEKAKKWNDEMSLLRAICLDCGLEEDFKWMHPCYTFNGKNIVLIHDFKQYCALLFHKGVLMKDTENILVQQTKNVQSARQLRFTSVGAIKEQEKTIKAYMFESIQIEKDGQKVKLKRQAEPMPEELEYKLSQDSKFKKSWEALTPGRQRGYLLHYSAAKQSQTRVNRIEKSFKKISEGKGVNER